ncbi:Cilia- and flagella-associated protein 43 [Quaeritorhiza haematococci]|nr:Cilia- and flagella-associated protein 43 [Quaeritorhiza haematococci]
MTGFYGDLDISASVGHTATCTPTYVTPTVFAYVSGHCLNFIDTAGYLPWETRHRGPPSFTTDGHQNVTPVNFPTTNNTLSSSERVAGLVGSSGVPAIEIVRNKSPRNLPKAINTFHYRPLVAAAPITAFAVYRRDCAIAVAEHGSSVVKLYKWNNPVGPSGVAGGGASGGLTTVEGAAGSSVALVGTLQAPPDHSIISLAFSMDGSYLASLGSFPTYNVCIWDRRNSASISSTTTTNAANRQPQQNQQPTLLCSIPNSKPASWISFDPLDSTVVCTGGFHGENGALDGYEDEEDIELETLEKNGDGVQFWKMETRYKKCTLKQIHIRTPKQTFQWEEPTPPTSFARLYQQHAWTANHEIIVPSRSGDTLRMYDVLNNRYRDVLNITMAIDADTALEAEAAEVKGGINRDATKQTESPADAAGREVAVAEGTNDMTPAEGDAPAQETGEGEAVQPVAQSEGGAADTDGQQADTNAEEGQKESTSHSASDDDGSGRLSEKNVPEEREPQQTDSIDAAATPDDAPTAQAMKMTLGSIGDWQCIAVTKGAIVLAGWDGILRCIDNANEPGKLLSCIPMPSPMDCGPSNQRQTNAIRSIGFSPDHRNLVVALIDGRIVICQWCTSNNPPDVNAGDPNNEMILLIDNDTSLITCLDAFHLSDVVVSASRDGTVSFWWPLSDYHHHGNQPSPSSIFDGGATAYQRAGYLISDFKVDGGACLTSVATCPMSQSLVAVGSKCGVVRVYDVGDMMGGRGTGAPRLVFRERLHTLPVVKLLFDSTGQFLFSAADDGRIHLIQIFAYNPTPEPTAAAPATSPVPNEAPPPAAVAPGVGDDATDGTRVGTEANAAGSGTAADATAGIAAGASGNAPTAPPAHRLFDLKIQVLGYVTFSGRFRTICSESEELNLNYGTTASKSTNPSTPLPKDLSQIVDPADPYRLTSNLVPVTMYRIESPLTTMVLMPNHLSNARETFVCISENRSLVMYKGPVGAKSKFAKTAVQTFTDSRPTNAGAGVSSEVTSLGNPMFEVSEHEKSGGTLRLSISGDWLITWAPDGQATVRLLTDLPPGQQCLRIRAHDFARGGVRDACLGRGCRALVSLGFDGTLRFWDWKFTAAGRRAYAEAADELARLFSEHEPVIAQMAESLQANKNIQVQDRPESESEPCMTSIDRESRSEVRQEEKVIEEFRADLMTKINSIKEQLVEAIQLNDTLPDIERIGRDEFVIDFEERDRLIAEGDEHVRRVRMNIEQENLKKRVIKNRIKKECWDSMEVIGQAVKSFNREPMTNRKLDVPNYPIQERDATELERLEKMLLLRRTQIMVANATKKQKKTPAVDVDLDRSVNDNDLISSGGAIKPGSSSERLGQVDEGAAAATKNTTTNQSPGSTEDANGGSMAARLLKNSPTASLLYDFFELNTNERRRVQVILLSQVIHEIKTDFNQKFLKFVKSKRDEIAKIEDKNERITQIMSELQIQETIFRPTLDNDEVPERNIEVADDEVKSEKFLSPEELKKLEAKRLLEEKRLKQQQEDNFRERALQHMMGGKLEDRADQEEKEDLTRPEWMNKPKEDMTDEERKLVKEFEKKVAQYKEEQEKYRRALETELRKLQAFISELCETFDTHLQEFFQTKLATDDLIYQLELKIIKLTQACALQENDEWREAAILTRLETAKASRALVMAEIPEIKKELEQCREEYENAQKKDKEVERQFRKELQMYDFYFDGLLRLFKKRDPIRKPAPPSASSEKIINPFGVLEKNLVPADEPVAPLNMDTDLPEGLGLDIWAKVVELRDKKIASEQEVRATLKRFQDMQMFVQRVVEESEALRVETEKIAAEMAQFLDYKFHNTYNVETLFELKQGQVEVPQAPVVTDYSDAVLIHRSVVEKLNESIRTLGRAKVEALKGMKEYRKGIHALEWENKMLDFQAEDLVIKTRDIQLLRVSKQMQEYIRGGDEHKHSSEVAALERRADYSQKAHVHKVEEMERNMSKLERKIREKTLQNERLSTKLVDLELKVKERKEIEQAQGNVDKGPAPGSSLKDIYERRRLVDLAKAQAQDLAILQENLSRLRLRTYPAFPANMHHQF